jgi:predicted RNase H-like HicB family nuclease
VKAYTAVIEQCPDTGMYVGYVPGFLGAHSQAGSSDELNANLKEVIEMLLEEGEPKRVWGGIVSRGRFLTALVRLPK